MNAINAVNMLRCALIDRYYSNIEIVDELNDMDFDKKRAFINLDLKEINFVADCVVRRIIDEE